ncbi:DUF4815 domain-containing protein [Massilia sp. YIM B04103]|uniref:DUF4815 domain-containing protein n=1 Tax=Massilia sp. YIM B04103 TaxID=2963106 RepID=UPI00210D7993|nr:DUF4815 domain-containing protein [Massilia sp. YIM B04103]
MIEQYYNRFNPADNYEQVLFRSDRVLQSAELNEIQAATVARLQGIGDALFKDGDIVRDARVRVDPDSGETICEAGAVYLRGSVRAVASSKLTIPVIGNVSIGLYLKESVVTELEAPALRNPASGTRGYQEPGAARQKLVPVWGVENDGRSGDFYPIYQVENGMLRAKEAPPNLDGVTQALARYDRDSSGGSYVVSGLNVAAAADVSGSQVYTVSEGRARVNGFGVALPTSRRVLHNATPDLRNIGDESHISATVAAQRVDVNRVPLASIASVSILREKTASVVHGSFTNAKDLLPDTSVSKIVSVTLGGTTYTAGTDYKLSSDMVDWSLPGTEPSPGTTYQVTYQYRTTITPTAIDDTGFTVTGAVASSEIFVSYSQKLPRIDRLCVNADGGLVWLKGVAAEINPLPPAVPDTLLALASVQQTWQAMRPVSNDGVRVVPMQDIANINARMDYLSSMVAQQVLKTDAANRDTSLKKGMFVDPFLSDDLRDQGVAQTAAIVGGKLTLPVTSAPNQVGADVPKPATLNFTFAPVLSQLMRTGDMLINPYSAFDPIPADVTLVPAIDRWTEVDTTWSSPTTERIVNGGGRLQSTSVSTSNNLLSSTSQAAEKLRQLQIKFTLAGFGPNEVLSSVTFDGINVTPTP